MSAVPPDGTLPANVGSWEQPSVGGGGFRLPRTPKGQVLLAFGVLLAVGMVGEASWSAVFRQVATAVGVACLLDLVLGRLATGRWQLPSSALLTGLIVAFVLDSGTPVWVTAATAGSAIASKYLLRNGRGEHLFNPAAFALACSGLVLGASQSWWGALGNLPVAWTVLLVAAGLLVIDRLNKLPLVFAFLGTYFALFVAVSFVDATAVAEMFREPFVQAAVFLAFFMLTDPPTSPNVYQDQVTVGVLTATVACLAQLIGIGQVYLLLGVLTGNGWLALRRRRRRARALERSSLTSDEAHLVRSSA
ncbi:MAG: RnfABCDGE type electron transport complex subunit D [Chloroflexi bacterium]|nr:RnfABCDGE type electron transport complex subunit D [Chloroflexota bacterium]